MDSDLAVKLVYTVQIFPSVHHVMGGTHGGNVMASIMVFGQITAASAIEYLNK